MVEVFDKNLETNGVTAYTLNVKHGDKIIVQIDSERWDLTEAQQLLQRYSEAFPYNTVICTFDGIEIKGVIKDE